ncbi:MAG: prepilin-type N-terminal cleavage/methylation domain-containing protein [Phycisphaeraceae bacterium]|nr:prepilin-type N-terminal cleavage/methylation domain-containing protein [Phycisphaeraceae bacterium]
MSIMPPTSRRGFTLIEAAVSTVIVGTMVAAAVAVVGTAAKGAAGERAIRKGQTLAHAMMSEVLAAAFADPDGGTNFGLDSNESHADRTTLDDVDDFHGLIESWPTDHLGRQIPWAKSWQREVKVNSVAFGDPNTPLANNVQTGLKRVTVVVTSPEGRITTMVGLKSAFNPIDARPADVGAGRAIRARAFLQIGSTGSLLVAGAELLNTPSAATVPPPIVEPEPQKVEGTGSTEVKK